MNESTTVALSMVDHKNFGDDFIRLTGHRPFPWQRRLFREWFAQGCVSSCCDIPTGLGKTSVMAIWYLALRAGASVPRRLVYVVDRRAVVDQATTIAGEIKEKSDDSTLRISTLRGQHVDNRAWLADPAAPAIIVGTIDMIGSRLLFSGYGVSRRMRPYHAGLMGADTLVILDESHLVPPFERLLEAIENGMETFGPHEKADRKVLPRFKLLSLSATGRTRKGAVFQLDEEDLKDTIIQKRLEATKRLKLVKASGKNLEGILAERAWALSGEGTKAVRCLVYCNSRETAEKTAAAIEKLATVKKNVGEVAIELFVGARRVKERVDAAERLKALGFLASSNVELEKPAFLISTSAGEVGVDLDADHMVCDPVSWERMVQRLGRVNRRGDGDAHIDLVHMGETIPKKKNEPRPEESRAMIAWRSVNLLYALPNDERGIDVSPGALRELKLRAESDPKLGCRIEAATTPEPLRPALTRALVDAWSKTSLDRHTGRPEIGPWLRGWIEDDRPQTSVVWRTNLPVRTKGGDASSKDVEGYFEAAPPHTSEELETETWRVADWLIARASVILKSRQPEAKQDDEADVEEFGEAGLVEVANRSSKLLRLNDIVAFALSPAGDLERSYRLREFDESTDAKKLKENLERELTGATLIVDARLGGLTYGLLDKRGDANVRTADDGSDWLPTLEDGYPVVRFFVQSAATSEEVKGGARETYAFATRQSDEGEDIEVLRVETWATEDSRAASINPQLLTEHHSWTERRALAIAEAVGLTGDYRKALTIAARLHDEGKGATRWQRAFNAPSDGKAYAKTKGPLSTRLLDGYRHEFGLLPIVEKDVGFGALPADLQDLVLHLVAAHHGFARPLIATGGCEDAPPSALEKRACEVALRFARLQKRWGPWGLAWWEALLRAADQQASRDNDARGDTHVENTEIEGGV
jgi:CRISPR-associated endonuclease/helicase Cas3